MNLPFLDGTTELIPNPVVLMEMVSLRVRQLTAGFSPVINVPPGMIFSDVALSEILSKELGDEPGSGTPSGKLPGLFLGLPATKLAA